MRFQNYAAALIISEPVCSRNPAVEFQPRGHKILPTDMKNKEEFSTPAFSLNRSKEGSHRPYSGCMLVGKANTEKS